MEDAQVGMPNGIIQAAQRGRTHGAGNTQVVGDKIEDSYA